MADERKRLEVVIEDFKRIAAGIGRPLEGIDDYTSLDLKDTTSSGLRGVAGEMRSLLGVLAKAQEAATAVLATNYPDMPAFKPTEEMIADIEDQRDGMDAVDDLYFTRPPQPTTVSVGSFTQRPKETLP